MVIQPRYEIVSLELSREFINSDEKAQFIKAFANQLCKQFNWNICRCMTSKYHEYNDYRMENNETKNDEKFVGVCVCSSNERYSLIGQVTRLVETKQAELELVKSKPTDLRELSSQFKDLEISYSQKEAEVRYPHSFYVKYLNGDIKDYKFYEWVHNIKSTTNDGTNSKETILDEYF